MAVLADSHDEAARRFFARIAKQGEPAGQCLRDEIEARSRALTQETERIREADRLYRERLAKWLAPGPAERAP
jgi:hypothetical protein